MRTRHRARPKRRSTGPVRFRWSSCSPTRKPRSSSRQAQPLGSISGRVFEDYDGNGLQGPNEPGLAGQIVFLDLNGNGYMDDNEPRTVTNEKGEYRFLGLTPGTYRV